MTSLLERLRRVSVGVAVAVVFATVAIPLGRSAGHGLHASAPAEVLGPLPSAGRMVPAPGSGLFVRPATTSQQALASHPGHFIKRTRHVGIDPAYRDRMIAAQPVAPGAGSQAATGAIDTFKLTLFDDTTVTLYKTGMRQDSLGSTIWTGRVTDADGGEALLVLRNGRLGGTVRVGKRSFTIEPMSDGGAKIAEADPDLWPHHDPLTIPSPIPAADSSTPSTAAAPTPPVRADGTPTVINILVAYTPAAAVSITDIQSAISMGISYTNQVLINSGLNVQMNLVGITQVNFNENETGTPAGAVTIVQDAAAGTGAFAALHAQRDTLGADLVSVWSEFTDACGVAYQIDNADMVPTSEDAPYGYNAISVSFGYGCLTEAVAHEIGHNLGAAHDRYVDDPTDQLTSRYNFGYVDIPDRIRTIMSYPNACSDIGLSCTVVPYHSSPNLTYQGHVLGIADSAPNAADNVRRIGEIAPYIGLFRSGGTTTQTLTVVKAGSGTGTVTSAPAGISCGATCSAIFPAGSAVTLTANAPAGSTFSGWSGGGCTGTGPCTVTMSAALTVTASFTTAPVNYTLTVNFAGSATGTITSQLPGGLPGSLSCTANCSQSFASGASVTLVAMPNAGAIFTGWGGACSGTNTCTVAINANTVVVANFAQAPVTKILSVLQSGTGSGTITSNPAGLFCGACSISFLAGTVITLTATPDENSTFIGWSGACSGAGSCTVTLNADTTVTASFRSIARSTLTVLKLGTGTVVDVNGFIACGNVCSATYVTGSSAILTASGSTTTSGVWSFSGWDNPACTDPDGLGRCVLTLGADATVTARFTFVPNPSSVTLSVSYAGTGLGEIAGMPNGPCVTCSYSYSQGTVVTLTANPFPGSTFTGWSGAGCSGTGSCSVALNADTTVIASYTANPLKTLTISKSGAGAGVVTSITGGISCGAICSVLLESGSNIGLNAAAAQGSVFTGWIGGGCFNLPFACGTTLNADTTITANFDVVPQAYLLSISKTGAGSGSVTSSPSGIACGATCNASFTAGENVTFAATASNGSVFTGWSGGRCGGDRTCTVSLSANTTVTANFVPAVPTSISLQASILPSGRSVQVGALATFFGSMINVGPGTATFCSISPSSAVPGTFSFQTTDPATNQPTGTLNAPVDIPEGKAQTFFLSLTPSTAMDPMDVAFDYSCSNAAAAPTYSGVNTLLLSASPTPVPDMVALVATASNDGILHIVGNTGEGAFAVATSNVGSTAQITAQADSGSANLPLTFTICQTTPAGACMATPTPTVTSTVTGSSTASYAVFATAHAAVPFSPAVNRIYVHFMDAGGTVRGSTSVAVETQ